MGDGNKQNEREFLAEQAALAKRRIGRAAQELATHLGEAMNPVTWAKTHPIAAVSTAAAGGFVAVAAAARNGNQAQNQEAKGAESEKPKGKHDFVGTLVHEVIGLVRPVVASAVTAYMASSRPAPDVAEPTMPGK